MDELLLIHEGWYESVYLPAAEKFAAMDAEQISSRISTPLLQGGESILSVSGDHAVISIRGMLSKNGPGLFDRLFGIEGTSYSDIMSALSVADAKLPVGAKIILDIDSPGGQVSGAKDTYDAIRDVGSRREIMAVNSGLIASAAMWLASAADKIFARNEMAMAGSIGVVIKAYTGDSSFVNITNTASSEKAPDMRTESGRAVMRSLMDDIYGIFLSDVLSGRGSKTSAETIEGLKGRVVVASKAIEAGLMDGFIEKMKLDTSATGNSIGAGTENGPASAGAQEENETMDDKTKAEVAAMIAEAIKANAKAEDTDPMAAHKALVAAVSPFISNAKYSDEIRAIALKCLSGEASIDALRSAASAHDAKAEQEAAAAAAKASKEAGETPSAAPDAVSADGMIETEAQYQALMAQYK